MGVDSGKPGPTARPDRLTSIDAYRGFVMLLMMAEVLRLSRVARALPESQFWKFLAWHQSHVEWVGCSLHDLIQPSFSFLVGVALPFSIASRAARGQTGAQMLGHALWRAVVLILLGVFLRSTRGPITQWTFEDTLTQIGLGYAFLFGLGLRPARDQWIAFGTLLVGVWALFAVHPLPGPEFDYAKVGVPATWLEAHGLSGFAGHWQKNSNAAWAFDTWFLNLFPRERPFLFNRGGYATLSFLPTLATMILGLIAGGWLRRPRPIGSTLRTLLIAGVACLLVGSILGVSGVVPVVKRIWTPSWVLYSGGWCLILLAGFYALMEAFQLRRWAFPLVVVGMNSIAAYLIAHLFEEFILKNLVIHLGNAPFLIFGPNFQPLLQGAVALLIMWLLLYWMYRRKLFLRI